MKTGPILLFAALLACTSPARAITIIDYEKMQVPGDILKYVFPGASDEYIRETLGVAPVKFADNQDEVWFYPFKDVDMAVCFRDNAVLWLSFISYNRADRFPVYPLYYSNDKIIINETSLGSISDKIEVDIRFLSSRFSYYELNPCYFGRPGRYLYYEFGKHLYSQDPEIDLDSDNMKKIGRTSINYVIISKVRETIGMLEEVSRDGVYNRSFDNNEGE